MKIISTKSFQLAINEYGDPSSKKVVLMLPGRLDTKDYECFSKHGEFLANLGYYAVAFDPPGTWDSPGGIELFTTTNYIKATNELIEHFRNKPTLLLGHSRGGAVASIVGTSNPHVVGLITLMESFGVPSAPDKDSIQNSVYIDHRDMPPGNSETKEQKRFEVPLTYFEDGSKYNDAKELKKCTKPKLIFYGTDDEFNTPEYVKKIFDSLPEPKKLVELKCNHDYRYFPEIVEQVNKEVDKFISEYLPNF